MGAARHLLGVGRGGVLGCEVWVDAGDELGWWAIFADAGELVGDGGVCVGEMRIERLLFHVSSVFFGCVVHSLAHGHCES